MPTDTWFRFDSSCSYDDRLLCGAYRCRLRAIHKDTSMTVDASAERMIFG